MSRLESLEKSIYSFINLDNVNVWFLRTEGGNLFQEYLTNKYISLGWNAFDKNRIRKETKIENKRLVQQIQSEYSIKTGQRILNQIYNFIHVMKRGDLVLLPNESSRVYSLVMLREYFEEELDYSVHEETTLAESLKSLKKKEIVLNPYKKRWAIVELGRVESKYLPPNIRIVLRNFSTMMNLSEYKVDALCAFFPIFYHKDALYVNFKVEVPEVTARVFSNFVGNTYRYLKLIAGIDSSRVITQSNINSPGIIQTVIDLANTLQVHIPRILLSVFLLNILINGGGFGNFQVRSVFHIAFAYRREKAEIETIELNNEKKKVEIDLLKQELQNNLLNDAETDISIEEIEAIKNKAKELGYILIPNNTETLEEELMEDASKMRQAK